MKIIKPGVLKRTDKLFICRNCGCEFEADVNEYKYHSCQYNQCVYVCKCPCCGKDAFSEE